MFIGDGPATNVNQPSLVGFAQGVSTNLRRPFFAGNVAERQGFGGAFGWTQGIDYFCNCATNALQLAADEGDQAVRRRATRCSRSYTLQHAVNNDGDYFFIDPEREPRHGGLGSHAHVHASRPSRKCRSDAASASWRTSRARSTCHRRRLAVQPNTMIQSGLPFNVTYRNAGQDRDTGPNRPDLIGDPDGPQTRDSGSTPTPIGAAGQRLRPSGRGTFGNMERNALRGPGYWRTDASLFKNFTLSGDAHGWRCGSRRSTCSTTSTWAIPDAEVGVPGNAEHERRPHHRRRRSATAIRSATSSSV